MADGAPVDGYEMLAAETAKLSYAELRKRDRPFVMRLDATIPSRSNGPLTTRPTRA